MNSPDDWQFGDTSAIPWQVMETGQKIKLIAALGGTGFILTEVPAGFVGPVHHHDGLEYLYVLEGSVVSNGVRVEAGGGYIAAAGTEHDEFRSETGARFLVVFTFPPDQNANALRAEG